MELKIGVRPSNLAIRQAYEIKDLLSRQGVKINFNIVSIYTRGDYDKITPLAAVEGSDFFTKEIKKALLEEKIDAAVHSAKDLEKAMPQNLTIVAVTKSISSFESLVSKNKYTLENLPKFSIVGTSSLKRKQALMKFRNDLIIKDIRGTIEERLEQLDKGNFDAIVVAHAALLRLGLHNKISQIIPPQIITPHPLQGKLAIQIHKRRIDLQKIFGAINDKN